MSWPTFTDTKNIHLAVLEAGSDERDRGLDGGGHAQDRRVGRVPQEVARRQRGQDLQSGQPRSSGPDAR